jgi:hypothetical protein
MGWKCLKMHALCFSPFLPAAYPPRWQGSR